MQVKTTVLCLDAGFRNLGIAIWDCTAKRFTYSIALSFPKSDDRYVLLESSRVVRLQTKRLATIIDRWQPRLVVAELPFGGARNSRAATCMALACATIVSTCALVDVPLHAIRPQEIKKLVSGSGRRAVSKQEVIQYVIRRFGERVIPDSTKAEHIADAMAAFAVWKDQYERK